MKELFEKEAMSLATEVTDNSNDELSESWVVHAS